MEKMKAEDLLQAMKIGGEWRIEGTKAILNPKEMSLNDLEQLDEQITFNFANEWDDRTETMSFDLSL